MHDPRITRRSALAGIFLPLLAACSTPLPLVQAPRSDPDAVALLNESATTHGLVAYRKLTDVSVSYTGQWRPLINGIQPEIVDAGFRGDSQERLLPHAGVVAQAYRGPQGSKQVYWSRPRNATRSADGDAAVWLNGERSADPVRQRAAALVAEAYGLFLLGPMWLADRALPTRRAGRAEVDGRACDVVEVWLAPGLGRSPLDRIALYLDQDDRIMRRVRFTLEGFAGTQGAVAEVDTYEHQCRFGMLWPMRSFERVVHPIALPAHDWRLTGLDVNRGYTTADLQGPVFTGAAARAATPVEALRP